MLVSLAVMGYILSLPIPRIAINRIGTMDLEHLFGVTRVANRGNNEARRIRRRLVKSSFLTRIVEHWGLTLTRKRQRNISGVYDGMIPGEDFEDLQDIFAGYNLGKQLWDILGNTGTVQDLVAADPRFQACVSDFAVLLGRIKDGQRLPPLTYLGGTSIMARIEAIDKISGHTKLYWTVRHLLQLQEHLASGKSLPEIASLFGATVPEIQRGCKKLAKRGA
jgi:hypothetical protein